MSQRQLYQVLTLGLLKTLIEIPSYLVQLYFITVFLAIYLVRAQDEATNFDEDDLDELEEEETVRKHQLPEIIDRQQEVIVSFE